MIPLPPPGQGPIDPRAALTPPPPPGGAGAPPWVPPASGGWPMNNPNAAPPAIMQQQSAWQAMPPGGAGSQAGGPGGGFFPPGGMAPWGWGPPPGRPRGGKWRSILFAGVLCLLALSFLFNLILASGKIAETDGVDELTITKGSSSGQIAVLPLEGLVDEAMETRVERYVNRAKADDNVKAVILLIDTPGGSVISSDEIYKRIRKFKGEKNVPIVVAMRGMATSGGYYAACAADYIVAESGTLTGNIGVLLPRFNVSGLMDKWKIEENTIVSKGTPYKDAGSPFRPTTPADDAYFQEIADSAFAQFKSVVAAGRKGKIKGSLDDIANGKAYTAQQALDFGLIDEIDAVGYLDAAIAYATKQAGLTTPTVVKYQEVPPSLFERLNSIQYLGGHPQAGGVSINIDASTLHRLKTPTMMYLYEGLSQEK
jgi:protease-4